MLIWTKEKNDFCDCDLHNFSQFLWKTYLFDSFCCFYFFHFLICALVQLLPVRKNAHPKALLLTKRPRRLIGHTVCDDFQISMLYHSTFHGSIYNFSNIHTCFISEGKTYGICSFVISLLFHVVYIYRYSCLSWEEFIFDRKFFFCPTFFMSEGVSGNLIRKTFRFNLGGKFLIYQKRVGYYQNGICKILYQALFVILQERKEN